MGRSSYELSQEREYKGSRTNHIRLSHTRAQRALRFFLAFGRDSKMVKVVRVPESKMVKVGRSEIWRNLVKVADPPETLP